MKYILSLFLLISITLSAQDKYNISIKKNDLGGYDIIRGDELIYKFNKQNCDSTTLSTLDDIYYESTKEGNLSTGVNIINLPAENRFPWDTILLAIIAIVGSLSVALYTNWSNRKTQREQNEAVRVLQAENNEANRKAQTDQYNRLIRAESKRQWLEMVRNEGANLTGILASLKISREALMKNISEEKTLNVDEVRYHTEQISKNSQGLVEKFNKFSFRFHKDTQKKILDSIYDCVQSLSSDKFTVDKSKTLNTKFKNTLHELINDEQDKLDRGDF